VTIEAKAEDTPAGDDPTGWKAADELIGFIKDGPKGRLREKHDEYLYRK
jgi:hypothetical protein